MITLKHFLAFIPILLVGGFCYAQTTINDLSGINVDARAILNLTNLGLPAGVYLVKAVSTNNDVAMKKLIVIK